jgi:hypothetical protein
MSKLQKEYLLFMAFAALQEHGLFENKEYLESRFCHRTLTVSYPEHREITVRGVAELFGAIGNLVFAVEGQPWQSDSAVLRKSVREFLAQVKPV